MGQVDHRGLISFPFFDRSDDGLARVPVDGCLDRHLATGRQLVTRLSGSRRMVDPPMVYRVASKRTAGAALAGLIASILSSAEHTTTWAAVPLHLDKRPPLVIQLVTL